MPGTKNTPFSKCAVVRLTAIALFLPWILALISCASTPVDNQPATTRVADLRKPAQSIEVRDQKRKAFADGMELTFARWKGEYDKLDSKMRQIDATTPIESRTLLSKAAIADAKRAVQDKSVLVEQMIGATRSVEGEVKNFARDADVDDEFKSSLTASTLEALKPLKDAEANLKRLRPLHHQMLDVLDFAYRNHGRFRLEGGKFIFDSKALSNEYEGLWTNGAEELRQTLRR